jgi:acyl-CoA thioester hydrolase
MSDAAAHAFAVRVYYEDTDAAGVVYYANYLKYAERARTEMLRAYGIESSALAREQGLLFAVRRCAVDYLKAARLDDLLEVRSRLSRVERASFELEQSVRRDGVRLADMVVRIACVALAGRPARLPDFVRARLKAGLAAEHEG